MSKPQTVTVEFGGKPFTFRLSAWRRFVRVCRVPPGKPISRKAALRLCDKIARDAMRERYGPTPAEIKRAARCKKYILSGCRGCRLDTRDMPCKDTM